LCAITAGAFDFFLKNNLLRLSACRTAYFVSM